MIMFGQNNGGEDRFTPTRNLEGVRHGWSPQTPRRRCFIRIFIALTKVLMLSFTDLRVCIMWPLIYQSIKHCSWLDKPWYTCCSALESASVCEKNIKTGNYTVVHGRTDVRTLLLTRAPRDNTWDTAGRSSTSDATASMTILLARRPSSRAGAGVIRRATVSASPWSDLFCLPHPWTTAGRRAPRQRGFCDHAKKRFNLRRTRQKQLHREA